LPGREATHSVLTAPRSSATHPIGQHAHHAIAHNKIIVIDGETVLTGSFNFTKAAQEKNAENLLMIRDPTLAAQYTTNWEVHRQHSQPYVGRGVAR
jgi:phosphatidylserine/phosphatidylglycerophosphate/cardiolipin synthase-like enzyme